MLAVLYRQNDINVETKKMYRRTLNEHEKAWGPNFTFTLDIVNNLGLLYADQGKHGEAKKIYRLTGMMCHALGLDF
jgi:Tfp pilus assembly protein PilF